MANPFNMKAMRREADKMSRMSPEKFQRYDQGIRQREQAVSLKRAYQQRDKMNPVNPPMQQGQTPKPLSFEEWKDKELNEGRAVLGSGYKRYVADFKKATGTETPEEIATRNAQRMMQEDQFKTIASQKGLSPQTIDYILKNRIPASVYG